MKKCPRDGARFRVLDICPGLARLVPNPVLLLKIYAIISDVCPKVTSAACGTSCEHLILNPDPLSLDDIQFP